MNTASHLDSWIMVRMSQKGTKLKMIPEPRLVFQSERESDANVERSACPR